MAIAVFPDDESMITLSRVSFPSRIPSLIMFQAARSLTLPPGLQNSALAKISTLLLSPSQYFKRSKRNSGVCPICSMTVVPQFQSANFILRKSESFFRRGSSIMMAPEASTPRAAPEITPDAVLSRTVFPGSK